jgi:hypothetical protein
MQHKKKTLDFLLTYDAKVMGQMSALISLPWKDAVRKFFYQKDRAFSSLSNHT